jgi:hypothetical protein
VYETGRFDHKHLLAYPYRTDYLFVTCAEPLHYAVFTKVLGELAEELKSENIPVTDRLTRLPFKPDIIHGHHYLTTLQALQQFPFTPAIFVCHDHLYRMDRPPLHPNIRRYLGVSRVCMKRLSRDGAPEAQIAFFQNFVDLERFQQRGPLPEKPRRALVFSNYANARTQLPSIKPPVIRLGFRWT